jgi:hypothetical protein
MLAQIKALLVTRRKDGEELIYALAGSMKIYGGRVETRAGRSHENFHERAGRQAPMRGRAMRSGMRARRASMATC